MKIQKIERRNHLVRVYGKSELRNNIIGNNQHINSILITNSTP